MLIRRSAGIFCILALTFLFVLPSAVAVDPAAVAKTKPEADDAQPNAIAPRIELARDLASKLVRPDGMEFKPHRLNSPEKIDYFLVYFGAHWCPNCKKFTPKLTQFYSEERRKHANFEVIYVSADKDEDAMLQYMKGYKMAWPAVKFGEHKTIESLKRLAGRGYPCVALVDSKGTILAHSYGEDRKGKYVGPLKPVEKLKEILDQGKPLTTTKSVARANR